MEKKILPVALLMTTLLVTGCATEGVTSQLTSQTSQQNTTSKVTHTTNNGGSLPPPVEHTYPIPEANNDLTLFNNYYSKVDTSKTGMSLRNSIYNIVSKRDHNSYDDLWTIYKSTDINEEGYINDIYSNISKFKAGKDQAGNCRFEGDKYNREHCIPKSWWGGKKVNQGADPFIVQPSDGWVNSMRGNNSFGEVDRNHIERNSANYYSLLGKGLYEGAPKKVFEINDEYKGDMARMTFYACTAYNPGNWTLESQSNFTQDGTVYLTDYARKLFMKWHLQDPVSDWERKRNNLVQKETHNRNPYIDHPEWACAIWGTEHFE